VQGRPLPARAALAARIRIAGGACTVGVGGSCSLAAVGLLAGLRLAARRTDVPLLVVVRDEELRGLLAFTGLSAAVGGDRAGSGQPQRQSQPVEGPSPEVLQEVVHVRDAAAADVDHLHGPGTVAAVGIRPVLREGR